MKTLKKIWDWWDDYKTITFLGITSILQKLIELGILHNTKFLEFVIWLFMALGTGAFAHHVQKSLNKNKS